MGMEKRNMVREVLKSLCLSNGWSYGIFWSFDQQKSMLLTMEEAYYEDQMGTCIENMLLQVHTLGNGMVGNVAFTKGHQWIFAENYLIDMGPLGYIRNQENYQDECEIHSQFVSGIETIAIISVEPHGVLQFGSTFKILETTQFVDQTKRLFREIEFMGNVDIFNVASSYNYTGTSCISTDIENMSVIKSSHVENHLQMPNIESPNFLPDNFPFNSDEFLIDFPSNIFENDIFANFGADFEFGEIENIFHNVSTPVASVSDDFAPRESLFSKLGIDPSFTVSSSGSKLFLGNKRKRESYSNIQSCESSFVLQPKKSEESVKIVKKRAKSGSRPKPKDRQQIQDRISELRKLIPNGIKMSIDSLLAQTIKHMFYLESVTKHAENLKKAKARKDNDYIGSWVFESQVPSMIDPVVVKDLSLPGQKQIQIHCEEKGFFLEIVDVIQGFGFNILKGVMEIRENKIWACFIVESQGKKYATKQDIYLSLHQLFSEKASSEIKLCDQLANSSVNEGPNLFNDYREHIFQFPIDFSGGL